MTTCFISGEEAESQKRYPWRGRYHLQTFDEDRNKKTALRSSEGGSADSSLKGQSINAMLGAGFKKPLPFPNSSQGV